MRCAIAKSIPIMHPASVGLTVCAPQVLTLSIVTLTKSCLKAVDCTHDEALGVATLDAMPDIVCSGFAYLKLELPAIILLVIYALVVPVLLLTSLLLAKQSGRIDDHDYLQGHGWFLLKYRPVRAPSAFGRARSHSI